MSVDLICAGARSLGLELDQVCLDRLGQFAGLVRSTNAAYNLVSRNDIGRLESRHILDSLALGSWVQRNLGPVTGTRLLDVGTGGGFPGMVLAILWPEVRAMLVDRSARKCRFLARSAIDLRLPNVEAKCHDVATDALQDAFDLITTRAVAPVESVWPWVRNNLRPGGCFIHMSHAVEGRVPAPGITDACWETIGLQVPGLPAPHVITIVRRV